MTINSTGNSFHLQTDSGVRVTQTYNTLSGWGPNPASVLTTYNLTLTYQFYPHFHPYVLQLARELSQTDSVFDLLAMNVLYQANPGRVVAGHARQHPGGFRQPSSRGRPIGGCKWKRGAFWGPTHLVEYHRAQLVTFDRHP